MSISRREFVSLSAGAAGAVAVGGVATPLPGIPRLHRLAAASPSFDPWLEIDAGALRHNAEAVAAVAGGRPIIAVVKNNAYGLGLGVAGPILDGLPQISGFAVVRPIEAMSLRDAGVTKSILLMGPASDEEAVELVLRDVRLAPFTDGAVEQLARVTRKVEKPIGVHLYVDTGMGRMGLPIARALPWIARVAALDRVRIEGTFTELTEDSDFDREQVERLRALAGQATARGIRLGTLHAASSDAIQKGQTEAFLSAVRPGFALYGGYTSDDAMAKGGLTPAYRLKARVARIEQLDPGAGVSYHRRWKATQTTWIALLPVGHVDGYPSRAVDGGQVLIRDRLCRVIGTVSASHTVVELGPERGAEIGDEAILVGPERPELHPNAIARQAKSSEYDMFMHLNPGLRRMVV
ncbi:MAG: alanine racemase [Gemmatimonadetes bacterium]|nr:alanine racemase [Gemmatimonadota bacterium]